jgi:flavin reductase (DIM6/NTAB) family NADH-FMN oxidoreductase RutF
VDPSNDILIDPKAHAYTDVYKLMIGAIVPRPIAFVSSVDRAGAFNLAPFSYFTLCSSNPPYVVFSPAHRGPGKEPKDTLRNVQETSDFVVNTVSEEMLERMNATGADFPHGVDEFAICGLTPTASERVKSPRVAEAHVQMECVLHDVITLSDKPGGGSLVIGEIVLIHVDRNVLANPEHDLFKIDPEKLRAMGRMGGPYYTRSVDLIELERPKWPS